MLYDPEYCLMAHVYDEEAGKRIEACLNACAGIPSDRLGLIQGIASTILLVNQPEIELPGFDPDDYPLI